jgi:hypothetical protein
MRLLGGVNPLRLLNHKQLETRTQTTKQKQSRRIIPLPKLIMLLGLIRILYHLPYRQLEGFIRTLAKYAEGLQAISKKEKGICLLI